MDNQLSITKQEINLLPLYKFDGKITVINNKEDALDALSMIKKENVLGFDTETRASFKKGEKYNISLLQLATNSKAYLFRLNKMQFINELVAILKDPNIIKAGVGIQDDIKKLQEIVPFKENGFVDLAVIAKQKNIKNFGLRALTAILLKRRLSKGAQTSNWEKDKLTRSQISYAACDAVVGYEIYKKLCI